MRIYVYVQVQRNGLFCFLPFRFSGGAVTLFPKEKSGAEVPVYAGNRNTESPLSPLQRARSLPMRYFIVEL